MKFCTVTTPMVNGIVLSIELYTNSPTTRFQHSLTLHVYSTSHPPYPLFSFMFPLLSRLSPSPLLYTSPAFHLPILYSFPLSSINPSPSLPFPSPVLSLLFLCSSSAFPFPCPSLLCPSLPCPSIPLPFPPLTLPFPCTALPFPCTALSLAVPSPYPALAHPLLFPWLFPWTFPAIFLSFPCPSLALPFPCHSPALPLPIPHPFFFSTLDKFAPFSSPSLHHSFNFPLASPSSPYLIQPQPTPFPPHQVSSSSLHHSRPISLSLTMHHLIRNSSAGATTEPHGCWQ